MKTADLCQTGNANKRQIEKSLSVCLSLSTMDFHQIGFLTITGPVLTAVLDPMHIYLGLGKSTE